jgi:predicted RNA-binding Zn-ribbon protein involved in translation (DUF1610 family)
MRAGKFAEAAERFQDLARGAEELARLGAAAELYLRAARCSVEVNDLDRADDCAERAIYLFIKARRPRRVRQVLPRVLAALERHGRHDDAERLRGEVKKAFQGRDFLPGQMPPAAQRGQLPAKCSSCGAPIKPDEVAWSDPRTAECPYCGNIIKTE